MASYSDDRLVVGECGLAERGYSVAIILPRLKLAEKLIYWDGHLELQSLHLLPDRVM